MCNQPVYVTLNDGAHAVLRPADIQDEARFAHLVGNMSDQSRYLRFFSGVRQIPQTIIHMLADADGHRHIAWGAAEVDAPGHPFIAAAHVFRDREDPTKGELAMGVLDAHHSQGLSRMLIACLALCCRDEGVIALEAETLSENRKANNLFRDIGGHVVRTGPPTMLWKFHVGEVISLLRAMESPRGLREVFRVNGAEH